MDTNTNDEMAKLAAEDIFKVLGKDDIPVEEKGILLAQIADNIQARTISYILDKVLTDTQKDELNKLFDAGDNAAVDQFIETNVPNYDTIYNEQARILGMELANKFAK